MERVEVDVAIVGGGVVGLALAESISRRQPAASIALFERHDRFGSEISSRNSEVVHAGLYYRGQPLKQRLCVEGRHLLYAFCERHAVPHRRCGKLIIATHPAQLAGLAALAAHAREGGVPIEELPLEAARQRSGNAQAVGAIWSPTTGIVDSHALMTSLEALARDRGVMFCYRSTVDAAEDASGRGCAFAVQGPEGRYSVRARIFLNAAGLASAQILRLLQPREPVAIRPCRGRYFALSRRWTGSQQHLLYPLPDPAGGLGVHLTFDLNGDCRLGPDVDWSSQDRASDDWDLYRFDEDPSLLDRFFEAGKRLLPALERGDLSPGYVGVRPKLFVEGVLHPDFRILRDPPGAAWHLLGIESPGLTAALALAEEIAEEAVWH